MRRRILVPSRWRGSPAIQSGRAAWGVSSNSDPARSSTQWIPRELQPSLQCFTPSSRKIGIADLGPATASNVRRCCEAALSRNNSGTDETVFRHPRRLPETNPGYQFRIKKMEFRYVQFDLPSFWSKLPVRHTQIFTRTCSKLGQPD
jgi:hypothetical protein